MKLVVDANILVAELLRERGLELVASRQLELHMTESVWSEIQHEVRRQAAIIERQGRIAPGTSAPIAEAAIGVVTRHVHRLSEDTYAVHELEARRRMPRDPDDWPTVAAALALDAGIWTLDQDFFGCGIATWITDTLMAHLTATNGNDRGATSGDHDRR